MMDLVGYYSSSVVITIISVADAGNTCKFPFFHDGIWHENCTLHPRNNYWCPTQVNHTTREQKGEEGYSSVLIIFCYFQMPAPGDIALIHSYLNQRSAQKIMSACLIFVSEYLLIN